LAISIAKKKLRDEEKAKAKAAALLVEAKAKSADLLRESKSVPVEAKAQAADEKQAQVIMAESKERWYDRTITKVLTELKVIQTE
jgi:hypothetical protein